MRCVWLYVKGRREPETVLKFTEKQWAVIQVAMKRDGQRSFQKWLNARIDQYPLRKAEENES